MTENCKFKSNLCAVGKNMWLLQHAQTRYKNEMPWLTHCSKC